MLRKICHIGNSYGVSIPKEILEKLHLTVGAQVDIKVDEKADKIIIKPTAQKFLPSEIDKEFASQVNDFIGRYKPALKALATKGLQSQPHPSFCFVTVTDSRHQANNLNDSHLK